jgi:hypothetical protein
MTALLRSEAGTETWGSMFSPRNWRRNIMGLGRGALLWLLGVPLPIVLLLALFWHH